MKHQLDNAIKIIKENGYKYTKKREEILLFLIEENRYVGAIEVFDFMNKQYQGISYDTIYRNLRDFTKMDLLEETELMGEKNLDFTVMYLVVTITITTIIILSVPIADGLKKLTYAQWIFFSEQLPDCQIESHRFEILGKCQKCLKK